MAPKFQRHPENPIVRAGKYDWRMAVTLNPAVIYDKGKFYMYERAGGQLRPFQCTIGMLESDDGIHFKHTVDHPVLSPETCGCKYGSVQDPRVVKIGDAFYMTFAFRPYAWHSSPTGLGVPDSRQGEFPGFSGKDEDNQSRSGVAVSRDGLHWEIAGWVNPKTMDDRNVILFPEKIGSRFAALRRPSPRVGTDTRHSDEHPCIRLSYSEDLNHWTEPEVVIRPDLKWENNRIGGSTPPIRTEHGWLVFYHGVENNYPPTRRVIYRMSAMLLDPENPLKVLARCPDPLMEPEEYYELFGLYIPNVIFPTGAVVKEGIIYLYYGVCDTAIALATVPLQEVVDHLLKYRTGYKSP